MEEILLQNSKNITALIHLMKVHEENIKRYKENMEDQDKDILMKPNLYVECEYSSLYTTTKMCLMSRTLFTPKDIVILVRECGHLFKKSTFLEWAATHSTCPRCTARIV